MEKTPVDQLPDSTGNTTKKKGPSKNILASTFHFLATDAIEYGVHEAVILYNLRFWVRHNIANESKGHFHDGLYWTYNSTRAFRSLFPFFSDKQIRTAVKNLVAKEVVKEGNFNKSPFDQTKWYTVPQEHEQPEEDRRDSSTEKANGDIEKGESELPEKANLSCPKGQVSFAQKGGPIPDINPDLNPNINPNVCYNLKKEAEDFHDKVVKVGRHSVDGLSERDWGILSHLPGGKMTILNADPKFRNLVLKQIREAITSYQGAGQNYSIG